MQRQSTPTASASKHLMKRRFLYMPNIDFERSRISRRLAKAPDSYDFRHTLLSVKAYLDYEDEDIIRVNFLDTLRPELWCIEGLARHLEPLPGRKYGLHLLEIFPRIPPRFTELPQHGNAWVLYVHVNPGQEIFDDAYFLKKVRDQIGFGSRQNIDVTILPDMQFVLSSETPGDEDGEILTPLTLATGTNTVVITALDQRIGTWLLFTLLCNFLDRDYQGCGFATTIDEKEMFAKWSPFTIRNKQLKETFGFKPESERFRAALEGMHYQVEYDVKKRQWLITPPIFRFDIIHPADILEDYLVATYYEEAKPEPLTTVNAIGSQTKRSELEERLVAYMQAYGARQTIGLLLDSYENVVERICHDHPERLIHLDNAVNKNREYAVDSSLPPLLRNAVHPSAPLPPSKFYLFTETLCLDYTLKRSGSPALIPGRQMTVSTGDITIIGQFGEVHPEVLTRWELFYPASFIELDLDAISRFWAGI